MNHDYNLPDEGTLDWHVPLNENFEKIDTDVEVRDADANRDSFEPTTGAKFLATDTGAVYLGDGSTWQRIGSVGENPGGLENVHVLREGDDLQELVDSTTGDLSIVVDGKVTTKPVRIVDRECHIFGHGDEASSLQFEGDAENALHIDSDGGFAGEYFRAHGVEFRAKKGSRFTNLVNLGQGEGAGAKFWWATNCDFACDTGPRGGRPECDRLLTGQDANQGFIAGSRFNYASEALLDLEEVNVLDVSGSTFTYSEKHVVRVVGGSSVSFNSGVSCENAGVGGDGVGDNVRVASISTLKFNGHIEGCPNVGVHVGPDIDGVGRSDTATIDSAFFQLSDGGTGVRLNEVELAKVDMCHFASINDGEGVGVEVTGEAEQVDVTTTNLFDDRLATDLA